jgi:hypothetical protein
VNKHLPRFVIGPTLRLVMVFLGLCLCSPTLRTLQYFFMYCNEGRGEKVVLTLSDSLYKKRVTTSGPPTTITKLGFRALCIRIGLAGSAQDTDLVFMRNLGVSRDTSKPPKFELDLDQACDALQMASEHKCVPCSAPKPQRVRNAYPVLLGVCAGTHTSPQRKLVVRCCRTSLDPQLRSTFPGSVSEAQPPPPSLNPVSPRACGARS